jgi:4-diphosphocytidyl-2-C-methyl-D-erythritol kinase
MRGIGQQIDPLDWAWRGWYILVNPSVAVSTPDVFRHLPNKNNSPLSLTDQINTDPIGWLRNQRNDLQLPAVEIAPVIENVLTVLSQHDHVELVRMSGSGATCFALFSDHDACQRAASIIQRDNPQWWVATAQRCD